jgi:FkbM family methyltransferase
MKIVYIVPHLPTGGMPEYLRKKIELLHKDHQIWVFEIYFESKYPAIRHKIKLMIGDRLISMQRNYKKLFEKLIEITPDIVHFEEVPETFLPDSLLEKIYDWPRAWKIIETLHDSSIDYREKRFVSDKMLVVSQWQVKNFLPLGIPIEIIEHEIIPGERNRDEGMKKLELDPTKKHVLQVGLFSNRKNQRFTFSLAREMPDVQFHFVGSLPYAYEDHWKDLVENKPDNCTIWGERDDVPTFYSCVDVVIFPSEGKYGDTETNPLAIKEAISWKIPLFLRNIPVYMNMYGESNLLKYITNSLEENKKILYNMLDLVDNYTLIKKDFFDQKLFNITFDREDNKLTLSYLHDEPLDLKVCIRDLDTEVPIFSFLATFENKNDYWTIPLPKHYYDFFENPNFSGFLVDFYDPGDNLLYQQSHQIKLIDKPKPKCRIDTYEPIFINYEQFFTDRIYDSFLDGIKKLDTVLDIGSSVGLFTKLVKDRGASCVIAFEVSEKASKTFRKLHLDDSSITLVESAIWDREDLIKIYQDPDNSIVSSAITFSDHYFPVPSVSLDSYFLDNNIEKVSLMKMDIEGSEYRAFDGLSDNNLQKIENIILEFHDNTNKILTSKILERLEKLEFHYRIFQEDCKTMSDGISDEKGVVFISKNENTLKNLSRIDVLLLYNTDLGKIRLGSENDGGYVLADGLEYDAFISCGLSDNIDFENDFLEKHPDIDAYLFDGTIEKLPETNRKFKWEKKNVSQNKNEKEDNLHDLIEKYKNIFIKMDIEASEFFWIESLSENLLLNISQLVVEVHYLFSDFHFFDARESFSIEKKIKLFQFLTKTHKLIHLSPNNCCDASTIDGILVPNVFECTFIRKDLCQNYTTNSLPIPGKLDRKNHNDKDDIVLNHYPFISKNNDYERDSTVVIIDSFVYGPTIETKLINQIEKFKSRGFDIILVSNTLISKEIQSMVNFFFYDSRNQLFSKNYNFTHEVVLKNYIYLGDDWQFTLNTQVSNLQNHGLSVLVNLSNVVSLAKSLGYTRFVRVEVDDIYGEKSLDKIEFLLLEMSENKKESTLFFNDYVDSHDGPNDLSFHLMIWDIDFYKKVIPNIQNENDYKLLLEQKWKNNDFRPVEILFRDLVENNREHINIQDGRNMSEIFEDTTWNTEASLSSVPSNYGDFYSDIFKIQDSDDIFLFSQNLSSKEIAVKFEIQYLDNTLETIDQIVPSYPGGWCWNRLSRKITKVDIFHQNKKISTKHINELKNWAIFPQNDDVK